MSRSPYFKWLAKVFWIVCFIRFYSIHSWSPQKCKIGASPYCLLPMATRMKEFKLLFGRFELCTCCFIFDELILLQKLWPGRKDYWPPCAYTWQSFGTTASTEFRGTEGIRDPNVVGPRAFCALWPCAYVQGSSASQGCTYPGTVYIVFRSTFI
jgi:hypothetical protein